MNTTTTVQSGFEGDFAKLSLDWLLASASARYSYNFSWMGRPIIQYPQDIQAMQEIIWSVRPDLVVETGIAHGGSLIFTASMLALLDMCDAIETGAMIDPRKSNRKVIGVDIDIRANNRQMIEAHPMACRIEMLEGSSVAPDIVSNIAAQAKGFKRVLVCLDSMHSHAHVRAELDAYAHLVSKGSYCVVFDTIIEDMPKGHFKDRPWDVGDNPKTAVWDFVKAHPDFEIDRSIHEKLGVTVAPDGYLKRIA